MTHNAEMPTRADVVVVGGGVIGASAAYCLSRAGIQVCLVERDDVGSGTSSAAAAAALLQTKTSATKLALAIASLKMLDDLYQEFDHCFEFQHSGSLLAACSEAELTVVRDMVAKFQKLGLAVRLVDGNEARCMMPVLGPSVVGASYSPADAQISPLELVVAYVRAARQRGARICTGTEVTGIERQGARIVSVVTNKGKILTKTVVDAAGVWSCRLAQLAGLTLPIAPLKGELLISEAMPRAMHGTLISAKYLLSKASTTAATSAAAATSATTAATGATTAATGAAPAPRSVGITLVQVARGNFLVGSTREPAGYDRHSTFGGISDLSRLLLDIAPSLARLRILRAYAGLRPLTEDMMPVIGPAPGLPGFIAATGHGGDGLALSTLTGKLVTDIVMGTADPDQLKPLSWERLTPTEEHR